MTRCVFYRSANIRQHQTVGAIAARSTYLEWSTYFVWKMSTLHFKYALHFAFCWPLCHIFAIQMCFPGFFRNWNALYIFKHFQENCCILIEMTQKFVSKGLINNSPLLVETVASTEQATSHCLIQWWSSLFMIYIYNSASMGTGPFIYTKHRPGNHCFCR